jgi:hypothetical protein
MMSLLVLLGILLATYRLAIAYRKYLRFDHSGLTILAAQIIVLLVFVNALVLPALFL